MAKELLITADTSSTFQSVIYDECVATEKAGGDFTIKLSRLLQLNAEYDWFKTKTSDIAALVNYIKTSNPSRNSDPQIFVPFLEDRDLDSVKTHCTSGMPIFCVEPEFNTITDEIPGYDLNTSGQLTQRMFTTEEYAWMNPAWVLIQEEDAAPGCAPGMSCPPPSPTNPPPTGIRVDGYREFGAIVEVPDVSEIESWVNGKVELRIIVYLANGTKIDDRKFEKVKRKEFGEDVWYDYEHQITIWNTSNIGQYMLESWWEVDGGLVEVSYTNTFAAPCTGCPAISVNYKYKNDDDELGQKMVQFSDPLSNVYQISYMNFKRCSVP